VAHDGFGNAGMSRDPIFVDGDKLLFEAHHSLVRLKAPVNMQRPAASP
jgi:hypothetical protein